MEEKTSDGRKDSYLDDPLPPKKFFMKVLTKQGKREIGKQNGNGETRRKNMKRGKQDNNENSTKSGSYSYRELREAAKNFKKKYSMRARVHFTSETTQNLNNSVYTRKIQKNKECYCVLLGTNILESRIHVYTCDLH